MTERKCVDYITNLKPGAVVASPGFTADVQAAAVAAILEARRGIRIVLVSPTQYDTFHMMGLIRKRIACKRVCVYLTDKKAVICVGTHAKRNCTNCSILTAVDKSSVRGGGGNMIFVNGNVPAKVVSNFVAPCFRIKDVIVVMCGSGTVPGIDYRAPEPAPRYCHTPSSCFDAGS